jgi:hypothetical protein
MTFLSRKASIQILVESLDSNLVDASFVACKYVLLVVGLLLCVCGVVHNTCPHECSAYQRPLSFERTFRTLGLLGRLVGIVRWVLRWCWVARGATRERRRRVHGHALKLFLHVAEESTAARAVAKHSATKEAWQYQHRRNVSTRHTHARFPLFPHCSCTHFQTDAASLGARSRRDSFGHRTRPLYSKRSMRISSHRRLQFGSKGTHKLTAAGKDQRLQTGHRQCLHYASQTSPGQVRPRPSEATPTYALRGSIRSRLKKSPPNTL